MAVKLNLTIDYPKFKIPKLVERAQRVLSDPESRQRLQQTATTLTNAAKIISPAIGTKAASLQDLLFGSNLPDVSATKPCNQVKKSASKTTSKKKTSKPK